MGGGGGSEERRNLACIRLNSSKHPSSTDLLLSFFLTGFFWGFFVICGLFKLFFFVSYQPTTVF